MGGEGKCSDAQKLTRLALAHTLQRLVLASRCLRLILGCVGDGRGESSIAEAHCKQLKHGHDRCAGGRSVRETNVRNRSGYLVRGSALRVQT